LDLLYLYARVLESLRKNKSYIGVKPLQNVDQAFEEPDKNWLTKSKKLNMCANACKFELVHLFDWSTNREFGKFCEISKNLSIFLYGVQDPWFVSPRTGTFDVG
jgi:hypothetical protein